MKSVIYTVEVSYITEYKDSNAVFETPKSLDELRDYIADEARIGNFRIVSARDQDDNAVELPE